MRYTHFTPYATCLFDSKKIIKKLLAPYKEKSEVLEITLQEGTVLSKISKAKAKGLPTRARATLRT